MSEAGGSRRGLASDRGSASGRTPSEGRGSARRKASSAAERGMRFPLRQTGESAARFEAPLA